MTKTLLLADDSVTIQRVVDLTFANEDVRVVSVGDGAKAVQWIETERPDIVVADVGVAGVDGYAIASHVKKSTALRHIPVLLLAGAFEPVDDQRARTCGSDGVLVKPFEPKHLVARVKELLAESQRWAPAGRTPAAVGAGAVRAAAVADAPLRPGTSGAGAGQPARAPWGDVVAPAPPLAPPAARAAEFDLATHELDPESPGAAPEKLELPTSSIWGAAGVTTPPAPGAGGGRVSLATAFSELLAAEQARPPAAGPAAPPQIPEAAIEEAVRRILARMTGEAVRQIVLDTAERLIREEIEKIKANPE